MRRVSQGWLCVAVASSVLAAVATGCTDGRQVLRAVALCPDSLAGVLGPNDSIQDAVDGAADGDVVCLGPGTYFQQVVIPDKNLSLVGVNGWEQTTIDAQRAGITVALLAGESSVSLQGLTITGGFLSSGARFGAGVSIGNRAEVSLRDVRITDNIAEGAAVSGVGLFRGAGFTIGQAPRALTLERVRIDQNIGRATTQPETTSECSTIGVGLSAGGLVTLRRVAIVGNRIEGNELFPNVCGGGAFVFGDVAAEDVLITDNTARAENSVVGAGMAVMGGINVSFRRVFVSNNLAEADVVEGAGLWVSTGTTDLIDAVITGNVAEAQTRVLGAGTRLGNGRPDFGTGFPERELDGVVTLERVEVLANRASGESLLGGGVFLGAESASVRHVILAGNALEGSAPQLCNGMDGVGCELGTALFAWGPADIAQTTVALNGDTTDVGSIWLGADGAEPTSMVYNSVVALNEAGGVGVCPPPSCGTAASGSFLNLYNVPVDQVFQGLGLASVPGGVALPPAFVFAGGDNAARWDLRLRADSPLVDLGDDAVLDADGTRSDPGAYGGPDGDQWLELTPDSLARLLE